MIRQLFVLATIIAFLSASAVHSDDSLSSWKAGVATTKITPDQFMIMAGYGARTEPADGKLTDLWAKALVIEDENGQRGVIVTLDLVGIDRILGGKICKSLQHELSLDRQQILLCTSHTHTGPAVGMNLAPLHYLVSSPKHQQQIDDYSQSVHDKVVEVVAKAAANLEPAKLSWGSGRATFAVNRRENKPYDKVPQWRTEGVLKGPVDHDVPVLAVRNSAGDLKTLLFGYACHATVLSDRKWSGDYPGFAQIELEKRYPNCVAMFWAGCGADQNPLPRRSTALAEHYGRRLADAVESVLLTSAMTPVQGELLTEYREIDLPLDELPTESQLEADAKSSNRYVASRAKMLLGELEKAPLSTTYPYPIANWKLGNDIQFVCLGGEVVVDYANRLKTELQGTKTWVAGYTNDVMAYIPSRRVLLEGGYEGGGAMVYYGLPAVWAPEVEQDIVAEVHRQLESLERQRAVDIGQRLELFVDDYLIASVAGDVRTKLMLPEPKEVVLTTDEPWEGNTSGYFTVFEDDGLYRMIYRGWQHDSDKKAAHAEVTCYAESVDGIAWTKPKLGLHEWQGSTDNNIVQLGVGTHNFTAFRDQNPDAKPNEQYKAFGGSRGTGGLSHGLLAFASPDCKSWHVMWEEPVITHGAFDSQNLAFWDQDRQQYRAYWRYFGDGVRAIRTATSRDFLHWENEADLTYTKGTPKEHLYTNAIQKYFRAPHLFIGFPTRFESKSEQVEPILMTSRDGVHFHRWADAVVPRDAPEDRNHNRSNYMAWGMFSLPGKPGEISVYATENYYEETPGRLRRFVYRTDGFVAVQAGAEGGVLTTRPLNFEGDRLVLNYKTRAGGSITVEALDRSGRIIGLSEEMSGDFIEQDVRWTQALNADGNAVRLRFHLQNTELFSIQFQN